MLQRSRLQRAMWRAVSDPNQHDPGCVTVAWKGGCERSRSRASDDLGSSVLRGRTDSTGCSSEEYPRLLHNIVARYCDPDANVQSGERFAEQSMLNTPLPRLSTDSIGGLSSPTVNWNHTRLRLQDLVFCGANACSDRKVMQLGGYLRSWRAWRFRCLGRRSLDNESLPNHNGLRDVRHHLFRPCRIKQASRRKNGRPI